MLAIVPISLRGFSRYVVNGQNPVAQVEHAGWSVTNELSADTFYTCLPVALLDGPILNNYIGLHLLYVPSANNGWQVVYAICQPIPSIRVFLQPSLMGSCLSTNKLAGA